MKTILNFPNYQVSVDGNIYSTLSKKFLKPLNNGNGYLKVGLYNENGTVQEYIHRLVAILYCDNVHNHKYVDHINRDKTDNSASNLRWVSAKENTDNNATKPRYSKKRSHTKAYPKELIGSIKQDYEYGARVMELSRKYNIPRQTISRFVKDVKQYT